MCKYFSKSFFYKPDMKKIRVQKKYLPSERILLAKLYSKTSFEMVNLELNHNFGMYAKIFANSSLREQNMN